MHIDMTSGDIGFKVYAYCTASVAIFITFFIFLTSDEYSIAALFIYLLYLYLSYY